MRRHARDARDRSEGRSDLIERGQDYKRKTIMPTHTRYSSMCGVSCRRRVVHPTIDLCERRIRFLQITNIPILNRPKNSADK